MTAYNDLLSRHTKLCNDEKEALNKNHAQAIATAKAEAESARATCAIDKAALSSAFDATKATLESTHSQAIATMEKQLESTVTACTKDKADLNSKHTAEMNALRVATLTTINAINSHDKAVANSSIEAYKKASADSYDLCVAKVEALLAMVYEFGVAMSGTNNAMQSFNTTSFSNDHSEAINAICGVNSNALTELLTNVDHIGDNSVVVNIGETTDTAGSMLLSVIVD
jgi:hypothetical protein